MQDIKAFEPLWGEWRSEELLGQGSFGRVYKMVKRDLDKEYYAAVKHLSFPDGPDEEKNLYSEGLVSDQETLKTYFEDKLKSLRTEIDLCYKLKGNTNIVSYEDHFIRPKTTGIGYDIFIKMELLTSLQDRIKEGGLTVRDAVKLGEDICRALVVLRREKIVHRDIKPGNIFINSGGDYKLGDFGVSRFMERTLSSMSVKGTLTYMAPELVKEGSGDYRVDIYSLGLVLYRLLNKNRAPLLPLPPAGVNHTLNEEAHERRLNGEALPPPADADEKLSGIVLKACAYRPQDRWNSAEEMGKALVEYRLHMEQAELTVPRDTEQLPDAHSATTVETPVVGVPVSKVSVEDEPIYSGNSVHPKPAPSALQRPEGSSVPDEDRTEVLVGFAEQAPPQQGGSDAAKNLPAPEAPSAEPEPQARKSEAAPKPIDKKTKAKPGPAGQKDQLEPRPEVKKSEAEAKSEGGKLQNGVSVKKAKPLIIAAAGAAVVLVGIICASAMANRPAASRPISGITPESVAASTEPLPEAAASTPIVWQDSVIRDGVLGAVGVSEEELTQETLEGLEELRLLATDPESGESLPISTWADLSLLAGLKTLEINGCAVEEFTFPADMPELETLKLIGCGCTSIEFLAQPGFQSLRVLNLSGNEITDLSPIAGLTELTRLDISQNPVTILAPLSGLPHLSDLWVLDIQAEDWSAVEHIDHVMGGPDAVSAQPDETQAPESTPEPASTPKPKPTPKPTPAVTAVASVSVSPSETLLNEGGGIRLSASISPSSAANQKVSWSSSNPAVAVVDASGYVSAVGRGTARIIATCDGKSGSCTVTVD